MNLHNLINSLAVFLLFVAFGAIIFTLAHFASRGAFSPTMADDDAAPDGAVPDDVTDEATEPVQRPVHGHGTPSSFDS